MAINVECRQLTVTSDNPCGCKDMGEKIKTRLFLLIFLILGTSAFKSVLLIGNILTNDTSVYNKDIYSLGIYLILLMVLGSISTLKNWRLGCILIGSNEILVYLSKLSYLKVGHHVSMLLVLCALLLLTVGAMLFFKCYRVKDFNLSIKYKGK